jgi:hypothetical protein
MWRFVREEDSSEFCDRRYIEQHSYIAQDRIALAKQRSAPGGLDVDAGENSRAAAMGAAE